MSLRARILAFVVAALLPPAPALAQAPDFAGVDRFWDVMDTLRADREPSERLWRSLFDTPAYRLLMKDVRMRRLLRVAYLPSLGAARDSILGSGTYDARHVSHLLRIREQRAGLVAFRDSLGRVDVLAEAEQLAARYLAPGEIARRPRPVVAFGLFELSGYGGVAGITLDLLLASFRDSLMVATIAHEIHHVHVEAASRLVLPARDSAAYALVHAIKQIALEGTADRLDIQYPFAPPELSVEFAARYDEEYLRGPATLVLIDSLLRRLDADPSELRAAGRALGASLTFGGHGPGTFMAERIEERFGRQALIEANPNPFAFIRLASRAAPPPGAAEALSPVALRVLERLEREHLRPAGPRD